ncbi:hemerythrin domain-containing protein [Chloroflexi bacterium TSY]|nr:hemerythrin domain-containing protein [Chloroflexi bacterium TSY]
MTVPFNYNAPENHVQTRSGLNATIRKTLLESERSQWPTHPRFGGKAAFFLNIHGSLLNNSANLVKGLQRLLDEPSDTMKDAFAASNLTGLSGNIISLAHNHHYMEDEYYFPAFSRIMPQIEQAIALLDGDHRVLEKALYKTESAMTALRTETVHRDTLAKAVRGARLLESVISRHLYDEEEIIIPIFLMSM